MRLSLPSTLWLGGKRRLGQGTMRIGERYRRLTLWNKLGVWGSVASVAGFVLALLFIIAPRPGAESQRSQTLDQKATGGSSLSAAPDSRTRGDLRFQGERTVGLGYWDIRFTPSSAGFVFQTEKAKRPSTIPWGSIEKWAVSRTGIGFYYYSNKANQAQARRNSRLYFGLQLPYGSDQQEVIELFRTYAKGKEVLELSTR